jgi:pimeloyl-ACP methyl ester carboxylesterase
MLETITRPTLLITGDANLYAPPPVQRLLADRITHAETLIIAEVGHAAY